MTTQTIIIPNPPSSKADAIECLTQLGLALKLTMETVEANPDWVNGAKRTILKAHRELNHAGYLLEDLFGVPDNTFGAGGGGKPPW